MHCRLGCAMACLSACPPVQSVGSRARIAPSLRSAGLPQRRSLSLETRMRGLPPCRAVAAPADAPASGAKEAFDASVKPPFTLTDIREAIPKECWEKNAWKSVSYVLRDVAIVFGLAAGAAYLNSWLVWPLYWIAQGTMFWALFVVGHDW